MVVRSHKLSAAYAPSMSMLGSDHMPKKSAKKKGVGAKSYRVITDRGDIRRQRTKTTTQRETHWPPLWQNLIASVGSYQVLADLWGVSHMKIYRWGVKGFEPSTLEKMGIRQFCQNRNIESPV
jgi:hypothetical protein